MVEILKGIAASVASTEARTVRLEEMEAERKAARARRGGNLEGAAATLWEGIREKIDGTGTVNLLWYDIKGNPNARVFCDVVRWADPTLKGKDGKALPRFIRRDAGLAAIGVSRIVKVGELKENVGNVHLCETPEDRKAYAQAIAPILAGVKPPFVQSEAKTEPLVEEAEAVKTVKVRKVRKSRKSR
jgi:hypothetical protein